MAARPTAARATSGVSLPLSGGRAERVAAAALVLVDGHGDLLESVDAARADLRAAGGYTVSYNETSGRPTSIEPCPVPIDTYSGGALRSVAFPCPIPGERADSAQLVLAVPVPKVEAFLRGVSDYGEVLGRSTQIQDEQQSLDSGARSIARVERQIARLRDLVAATPGDTVALRAQLSQKVAQLSRLEDVRAATNAEVRFAQVAINLTTVRPPDAPATRNWFAAGVESGWNRLERLARRIVSLLVVIVPIGVVLALASLPFLRRRRRRAAATS